MDDEHLSRSFFTRKDARGHDRLVSLRRASIDTRTAPSIGFESLRSADPASKQLYLAQLLPRLTDDQRTAIESAAGVTFGDYVPTNSYTVFTTASKAAKLATDPSVVWVGPYLPSYKVSDDVFNSITDTVAFKASQSQDLESGGGVDTSRLLVVLTPLGHHEKRTKKEADSIATDLQNALADAAIPAKAVAESNNMVIISFDAPPSRTAIDIVTADADVYHVEFVAMMVLMNKYQQLLGQSGSRAQATGTRPYWSAGIRGQGQIAAVADTGIDLSNCFFYDPNGMPVPLGTNSNHRKVTYYEVLSGADPHDYVQGHGTHVSGTLAGFASTDFYTLNDTEVHMVEGYCGNAPDARLYFQDVGEGDILTPGMPNDWNANLFPNPEAAGARVHSISWGQSLANTPEYNAYSNGIDTFQYAHPKYLPVVAAGNEGQFKPYYTQVRGPAYAKNNIVVGATMTTLEGYHRSTDYMWKYPPDVAFGFRTDLSVNETRLAAFSSRGPTLDARVKPDLVFPGTSIVSANSQGGNTGDGLPPHCDPKSVYGGNVKAALVDNEGTSMATPGVAGLAVLVRQYFTDGFYPTGAKVTGNTLDPSAALVKAVLINSAVPINGTVDLYNTRSVYVQLGAIPSMFQGWGRPQLDQTLYLAGVTSRKLWVADQFSVSLWNYVDFCVQVTGTSPLKVTLVWTDYPAAVGATVNVLVNDLDLVVGRDNDVVAGNWNNETDVSNNVEQVLISAPTVGTWKVRVFGSEVRVGPQNFALVITGDIGTVSTTGCVLVYNPLLFGRADWSNIVPYPTIGPGGDCNYAGTLVTSFMSCVTQTMVPYIGRQCSATSALVSTFGYWYSIQATETGTMTITTCDSLFLLLDTVLEVYRPCANECLASNDDDSACLLNPKSSTISFPVTSGLFYTVLIRTASIQLIPPTFRVCVTQPSPSPSVTPSITPTRSYSSSRTPSRTSAPSVTPSRSITPTVTPSKTPTRTPTPSVTPTRTGTPSKTPSKSRSRTQTPSPTRTPSKTPTKSLSSSRTPTRSGTPQ